GPDQDGSLVDSLRELIVERNLLGVAEQGRDSGSVVAELLRSLPCLQELNLSFNRFADLGLRTAWSWSASAPSTLTFADLSGNLLSALPGRLLAACPKLRELRLRQSRVTSLAALAAPDVAGHGLSTLDLEENQLTDVPCWLPSALPRLHSLLLSNNGIGPSLPPEFGFWESLQGVSLAGNPLKGIRQPLLAQGWSAVAAWLRDRLSDRAPRSVAVPRDVAGAGLRLEGVAVPQSTAGAALDRPPSRPCPFGTPSPTPSSSSRTASPCARSAPGPPTAAGYAGPSSARGDLDAHLLKVRSGVSSLEAELAEPG
ncbi:unnamed protein product, partial [Polarella glacialis]